jgi:hypothetical protein
MFVVIPTADKTISASTISSPFGVLMSHPALSFEVSTDSTDEPVITFMPIFLKDLSSCFETSSSSMGTILGKNSTSVTLVPKTDRN